jgi:uncharacterized protein (TIGR02266 family)
MAQMMLDMLADLPLEVSVARNGREALERAREVHPDLILLDVMMPEMDGFEVAAALRADPGTRDVPVIFITMRGGLEDKVRGLELGAEDYLVKPVQRAELVARVKNVLRRAEALRAASPQASLMRGRLEMMSLPNLIQVLEAERRTGALRLSSEGRRGEIWLTAGQIAFAVEGPRRGEAAIYNLLTWQQGEFELELTPGTVPAEAEVMAPNQSLLMEGMRRLDEMPALHQTLSLLKGAIQMRPVFREELLGRGLPGTLRQLVELCEGKRTTPQLLQVSDLDDWQTLTFLARFLRLGMLDRGQADKRGFFRLDLQIPVDYQHLRTFITARTWDLSAGGMFVLTTQSFPVGESTRVRFTPPGLIYPVEGVGRVMWTRPTDIGPGLPAGMGIQLLDLTEETRKAIERYIIEQILDRALRDETGE